MYDFAAPSVFETTFPYPQIAAKVALAAGIGLLVGLEREWAQKEIGVRTFAITGLLGMLTSLLAPSLVIAGIVAVLVMVAFLNLHSLLKDHSLELTTSACLIVTFFLGALVGLGHYFTAATSAIVMMLLLAWKFELERFAGALKPEEIRSAVLLGLLSVVVYPLLPNRMIDPWNLINPARVWIIVVVIAGIGFVNYVLLRLYSTKGLYYSAILGGLVNSTAAAVELASLLGKDEAWIDTAVAVLLLTNVAMFLRNLILLFIVARTSAASVAGNLAGVSTSATAAALLPLLAMAALACGFAWFGRNRARTAGSIRLSSPVSMLRVLKFAALFLAIEIVGTLSMRQFGRRGFLAVSLIGGSISSASTTATAAELVGTGQIDPQTAGVAVVLTSIASALVNLPLVYQQTRRGKIMRRLLLSTLLIVLTGIGVLIGVELLHLKRI
ncbi:MAG TPA: DUF4010 domain-containing protein [Tepidisphaeraceae bacterium]|nr:DUF4010 domain-containing protein [Tepidisphaeraceae bacterium]